mgnify:FL=1|tara:strand:- start:3831 stop:4667 length:837 start_codon:yes stop_codon:yes gene_type:complete
MDNTQTEAVPQADGLVDGGPSIVEEVRAEADEQYVESAENIESEEQVDFSAPEVETESETIPANEWEVEARKFQSMYDKTQAENDRLRRLEPLGDLLESRPDLVDVLQKNLNGQPQAQQPQQEAQQGLPAEDFNPWEAYYNPESPSFKFRVNQDVQMMNNVVNNALGEQKRQMTEEITYNNTVNELRNTYKMSDNDINEFMGFVTQPKEQVGLSNLVKLYRDVNKKSNAPETAEAVKAAQNQPRTAGVLQGGAPSSPKSEENKMWEGIVNAGSRSSVL